MGAFHIISDIAAITTGSAVYSGSPSEREGHPFSNAYLYPYNPDLEWRSAKRPVTHTLSITPTGSYDTVVFLGTNFKAIVTPGTTFVKHLTNDWRAIIEYSSTQTGAKSYAIQLPSSDNVLPYFHCWGIIAGTKTALGTNPGVPSLKRIYEPRKMAMLLGGSPRAAARGNQYHGEIRWERAGLTYAEAASLRDFKKDVGRATPFILYENQETNKGIYLVRRLDDFGIVEREGYYDDAMSLREIA